MDDAAKKNENTMIVRLASELIDLFRRGAIKNEIQEKWLKQTELLPLSSSRLIKMDRKTDLVNYRNIGIMAHIDA